jgi:Tol biopolymer transport system component
MRAVVLLLLTASAFPLAGQTPGETKQKLLIAFASYRDRPKQPQIYFYEHDGISAGKIVGSIDTVNLRSDTRPSLSIDGKFCAFASELENQTSKVFLWSLSDKKLVDLPKLNDSPNAQLHPTLSGNGALLAFTAWDRPGSSQRWDVFLYDVPGKKFLDLPGLNNAALDERMPCLSGDGRILAYTVRDKKGAGLTDIYVYDRDKTKVFAEGLLNSPHMDINPSLSENGDLIAFVSDRPGGAGGRDIYLFDRRHGKMIDLPGVNSVAHEQTPSLSANGRYIAFVSERLAGQGERDIFLYDVSARKLLPTPGLNSKREDIDPCVVVLKGTE